LAGSSLLALLDDIASLLDDVSVLTKVAAKKTAGVLGDDLALNAQQVSGVRAQRELPVVWAVAKGSLLNKAILVTLALIISRFAPWLVTPLLMLGGAYLCFEGFEKLSHKYLHGANSEHEQERRAARLDPTTDVVALERAQIKGAVRTDFVLSAEIITITLGSVADYGTSTQALVLVVVGVLMTIGVYGVVAAIVKLDDIGLYMTLRQGSGPFTRLARGIGVVLLRITPYLMKSLAVGGTIAMFLVGGGIVAHGLPFLHHTIEHIAERVHHVAGLGGILHSIVPALLNLLVGLLVGALVLLVVIGAQRLRPKPKA
jgi:uncharacterized protein